MKWTRVLSRLVLTIGLAGTCALADPPAPPQGLITGKAYLNISGTAVSVVTNLAKYPNSPDGLFFFPYFEWNASGDITVPAAGFGDNYGSQIVGYFYPPTTGDYIFWIASDDNGALYLSTDSNPANKKLIARETAYSNPREYTTSAGGSALADKDSSQFTASEWPNKDVNTGLAVITLQANQAYYIEAIEKEGGGGDHLSVAVMDPGVTIDSASPIPEQYLSSDRTNGPVVISAQPQSITVPERGSGSFVFMADGTPPYTFQWRTNGVDVQDATNLTFTVSNVTVADSGTKYSVFVTGADGTATSQDAILTVAPDVVAPTLLDAKGNPDLTELTLTFSEPMDATTAADINNYQISSTNGPLAVTAATLSASGTQVTLTTAQQVLGTKYTLLVSNIKDTAATPNVIAPNSKRIFFPVGKLTEVNGFIVFEAENYDRNLDGLWVKDTTRGSPSGGASMVNPNGAGGNENATQLEYDVEFAQAATYRVWYRASADNGNDDSAWFHLDGQRPVERSTGNQASMTGFNGALDFVWLSNAQDPPNPFTVDIADPGVHVVGLARREDGAFFDKFIFTTDMSYTPTGFGPPETREGAPGVPTLALTAPTAGQTFPVGGNASFTVNAAGSSGLDITKVQYTANGAVVGVATNSPFSLTWSNLVAGVYGIRATAFDELGQSTTSDSVVIKVGTPPPQALLVVGTASNPTLNPSDAAVQAHLETNGWQVTVVQAPVSTTGDADGKQLIAISSTVNSGDVNTKFRDVAVPVVLWEQAVQDDFLMTGNTDTVDRGTITAQTDINIVKADDPLAGGLTAGVHTVTTSAQDMGFGVPNTNAVIIATIANDATKAVVYGYDAGATLIDGTTKAAARRVMLFNSNDSFAAYTPDALKLFDAATQWASGIGPKPPKTSAKIAWVSFHPADNQPSANAAAAGFTNAPDIKYTDLLKANGHQVTRFVTTGTPDTNVLNAFDLVIISRSVPSGDYQDPPETLAWNGLTAPTMILGGYIIRSSRLGLMSGTTIPDTINPITLTVNDANHPIFAGIQLDANNTMVNSYADPVTFNGTLQRGISVVTDPVAGAGKVLATDGTAADPAFGGTIIAEWDAGDTTSTAAANVLGGHRLVFLTGSREANGLTSEGAGNYDLTADGAKMFINAVDYMAGVQPAATAPTIGINSAAGGITITFTGTLEASDSVTGGWAEVAGATSPYTVSTTSAMHFYRTKR